MSEAVVKRAAVVTGGSRGIGRAICVALAKQGCNVVVNYCHGVDAAAETVAQCTTLGVQAVAVQVDVSTAEGCKTLFEEAVNAFGRVDILVNNAGVTRDNLILRLSEEDFDRLFHRMILQFPACEIDFMLPGYLDALPGTHWIKATMIAQIQNGWRTLTPSGRLQIPAGRSSTEALSRMYRSRVLTLPQVWSYCSRSLPRGYITK